MLINTQSSPSDLHHPSPPSGIFIFINIGDLGIPNPRDNKKVGPDKQGRP
jgi:hypothetical protein